MNLTQLIPLAAEVVAATQRRLPPSIRTLAAAVPVHYEAVPLPAVLEEGFEPDILGLFSGNPYGSEFTQEQPAPPEIVLYVENLWDLADADPEVFRLETRLTYLHELGHYLGWDEDELAARGLD